MLDPKEAPHGYEAVKGSGKYNTDCANCAFILCCDDNGRCSSKYRKDGQNVYFKKLTEQEKKRAQCGTATINGVEIEPIPTEEQKLRDRLYQAQGRYLAQQEKTNRDIMRLVTALHVEGDALAATRRQHASFAIETIAKRLCEVVEGNQ